MSRRIDFTNEAKGLQIPSELFKFLQDTEAQLETAFIGIVGNNCILTGCVNTMGTYSPGLIIWANELFYFEGGPFGNFLIVNSTDTQAVYCNGDTEKIWNIRTAKFASSIPGGGTGIAVTADLPELYHFPWTLVTLELQVAANTTAITNINNSLGSGLYGGYSTRFLFNTTITSGPASTFLRFNNATYASITSLFVSETNGDSIVVIPFLDTIAVGGYIRIFKETDSTIFIMFKVTAVSDIGSSRTFTVTHIMHNGAFSASDRVILSYQPATKGRGVAVFVTNNTGVPPTNADVVTNYGTTPGFEDGILYAGDIWIDIQP